MAKKWYVYVHINPMTNQPFYIGKGTGRRSIDKHGRNSLWKAYTDALIDQGLTHGIQILHICSNEQDALDLEQIEIHTRLQSGQPLLNRAGTGIKESQGNEGLEKSSLIADFVHRKRKANKLTQAKCAKLAGVGLRFVRELEHSKPTLRLDKVNQVLYLFGAVLSPTKLSR
jgi:y4mF family transcriptional regulator